MTAARDRRRAPADESVVIGSGGFWRVPIIYHARADPGWRCNSTPQSSGCGHAMPRRVADKIAQPCARCYP